MGWEIVIKILQNNEVDWRKIKLIKNLYFQQENKEKVSEEITEELESGKEVRQPPG